MPSLLIPRSQRLRRRWPRRALRAPPRSALISALFVALSSLALVTTGRAASPARPQEEPGETARRERPAAEERAGEKRGAEKNGARKGSSDPGAAPADPVADDVLKVNYLVNRGLYELAIPRYEKIIEAHSDYTRLDRVHYPLALCYYQLAVGKPEAERREPLEQAVAHVKEALRTREFEARLEATRILAQSLLLLGDTAGAAKAFQLLVERSSDDSLVRAALLGLIEAQYFRGSYPEAEASARALLAKSPLPEEAARARYYLAMSIFQRSPPPDAAALGECRELFDTVAAASAEGAGEKAPFALEARYMAAVTLEKAGDDAGATSRFRTLLEAGAGSYEEVARLGLASAAFRLGRFEDAASESEKLLGSFPQSGQRERALLILGRAQMESGKGSAASKTLQEIRSSREVGDEASLHLGRLYSRYGKHRTAAAILQTALKERPESRLRAELELELATAQIADGKFEEASAVLDRLEAVAGSAAGGTAADVGSATAGAIAGAAAEHAGYLRIYALHRAARYPASEEAVAAFRAHHPGSRYEKEVDHIHAENLFLSGRYAEAVKAYESHLERFAGELAGPEALKARFRSAQALFLLKDYKAAREALEALGALRLGPEAVAAFQEDSFFATFSYLLGDCAYQLGDAPAAQAALRAFLTRVEKSNGAELETEAADARFKLGHSLELSGKPDEAREVLESAIARGRPAGAPDGGGLERVRFELGQIAYSKKDYERAEAAFLELVQESPRSIYAPHALRFLGWIAYQAHRYEDAARHYRQLVEEHPDHQAAAEAAYQLALSLQALGRAAEAREVLAKLRETHPESAIGSRALLDEAISLAREGRDREALPALEKLAAEEETPANRAAALYEMAWCQRRLGDTKAAIASYRKLLEERDARLGGAARLELGEVLFEANDAAGAKATLSPLLEEAGPEAERGLYRYAWCLHRLGEKEELTRRCEAFAATYPRSALLPELTLLAAQALVERGDPTGAAKAFTRILEADPQGPHAEAALLGRGECRLEERSYQEAEADFARFLKERPDSNAAPRARFGLAWSRENLGRRDEALELYRQVARETRSAIGARAQFQAGQCLAAREEYPDAIAELLLVPATFSYPEWSSRAILQAAGCFEALGDLANARKHYREVVATFPDRDEARLAAERLEKLEAE